MSSILRALAVCAALTGQARADEHLRFTDVTLPSAVTEKLLHAGRASAPDDVARQLAEDFPDLYIVVFGSNLTTDQKLRWRDPRVDPEVTRYYVTEGWLTRTLDKFLPAGYTPFRERPLMNHDLLLVRDYASRDVLLSGALKHAIRRQQTGRRAYVEIQEDAFEMIDGVHEDADEAARLGVGVVRHSSLQEVDVIEWLLNHRRDLRLTPAQLKSLLAYANGTLVQALTSLNKIQKAAAHGVVDTEIEDIRSHIAGVLPTLRTVGCELDL